jgi:cobyrinic acid a,c-diamide synthase
MGVKIPRVVIAGVSGDAGKTLVSLSLLAALRRRGLHVAGFKKGPDYIDPAWLSRAAGSPCRNLDTYLVDPSVVRSTFVTRASAADVAVIEGNRGLYDGFDAEGTHSTAQLARLLEAPVILVVNATKTTRTVAALVKGCQVFEPDVKIAGVVVNRTAGERHRNIVSQAIEQFCGVPVLGALPKLGESAACIPGRHLGLVPPTEHAAAHDYEQQLIDIAEQHLDIDRILAVSQAAAWLDAPKATGRSIGTTEARIGYFRDSAFTFYYPENLEALDSAGATLIPISSLHDTALPDLDGLYIGGGFPETHVEGLADNRPMLVAVKQAADAGMPIYAECGGLIYLSRSLTWQGRSFDLAGVFPVDLDMTPRPIGHGYTRAVADRPNPYFATGTTIKGHEFHYSGLRGAPSETETCLALDPGVGVGRGRDGLVYNAVMASYMHIHADGAPDWAPGFVVAASQFRAGRKRRAAGRDEATGDTDESAGAPGETHRKGLPIGGAVC